jgi:hypothetical protein
VGGSEAVELRYSQHTYVRTYVGEESCLEDAAVAAASKQRERKEGRKERKKSTTNKMTGFRRNGRKRRKGPEIENMAGRSWVLRMILFSSIKFEI